MCDAKKAKNNLQFMLLMLLMPCVRVAMRAQGCVKRRVIMGRRRARVREKRTNTLIYILGLDYNESLLESVGEVVVACAHVCE